MLSPGTRLGPYEIVAPIGAGGMGEVYRASDTRLHRLVAIKVISERLRDRPDLRARFRLEANAIAALTHPHICQLYDVGQHGDVEFLVMEYVEGETLAERLARGRLPVDRAVIAAREIADALEAAHRHGVVHRDVKPANVILTRAGVKLLDFGVARLRAEMADSVKADATGPPQEERLTHTGSALGTWRYMAPEHIRGGEVDARSDLFALGAVMYEMLTARPAFDGDDHHAVVTAILESDPQPMRIALPPGLEQIVRTCLAKQREDRWQSAGDLRRALETINPSLAPLHHSTPSSPGFTRRRRLGWAVVAAAAVAAIGIVAGWRVWATSPPEVPHTIRSVIDLAPEVASPGQGAVAFAPDGGSVVYQASAGGRGRLYRRSLSDSTSVTIVGTEDAQGPFFSPDGQWIGFYRVNQLMKVPIGGGRPSAITELESFAGASWGADNFIVVGTRHETGLFRVPAAGGRLEPFTVPTEEDRGNDHRFPQVLPGGRGVIFSVGTGPEDTARVVVSDLRSGTRKELLRGTAAAHYVPTGHLVYARNGELFAVPFDLERLELSGVQERIAAGVLEGTDGFREYSFSAAGNLVFVPGTHGGQQNAIAFVDMRGRAEKAPLSTAYYTAPRVSPDGRHIALFVGGAKNNVWVYDIARQTSTRVTFGRYHFPVWSPDGRLTVAQGPPGRLRLVQRAPDPGGSDEEITPRGPMQHPESWTPNGRSLIYERHSNEGQWDLWTVSPGAGPPTPLVTSRFNERKARVSPNGRWLAYVSDENGPPQIYVRALEGDDARVQISIDGSPACAWAPDSRRIFYRGIDAAGSATSMWAVDVGTGPTLRASRPKLLFANTAYGADFDVMPDGQRFVMVQRDPSPPRSKLHLVLNWFKTPTSASGR